MANGKGGDIVISIPSELISEIMSEYFNKKMFKGNVEIVDLRPLDDGYAFSLDFINETKVDLPPKMSQEVVKTLEDNGYVTPSPFRVRNNKGQFVKEKSGNT